MITRRVMAIWLITIAIIALTALPSFAAYETSLVGYWKLDEASGAVLNSANSNSVTTNVGATPNVAGKIGTAYEFTAGVLVGMFDPYWEGGGCIDVGALGPINDFSVNLWFKRAVGSTGYGCLFETYKSGPNNVIVIGMDGDNLSYFIHAGGTPCVYTSVTGSDILDNTNWHHVVATRQGATLAIYVDGVDRTNVTWTEGDPSGAIVSERNTFIAGSTSSWEKWGTHFAGSIDDVAFWNRTLDVNEADMVYDLGVEKFEGLLTALNNVNKLNLNYSTAQMKLLADLYGNTTSTITIGTNVWRYLADAKLPGEPNGAVLGDAWTYDGKSYIKLGSGFEGGPLGGGGEAPEPATMAGFGLAILGAIARRLRKR